MHTFHSARILFAAYGALMSHRSRDNSHRGTCVRPDRWRTMGTLQPVIISSLIPHHPSHSNARFHERRTARGNQPASSSAPEKSDSTIRKHSFLSFARHRSSLLNINEGISRSSVASRLSSLHIKETDAFVSERLLVKSSSREQSQTA